MLNNVSLIGRLGFDPDIKTTREGKTWVKISLAVDRDTPGKEVDWIPVKLFGSPANFAAKYIKKGDLVAITGSIQVSKSADNQGNMKTYTDIMGNRIYSLKSRADNTSGAGDASNWSKPIVNPIDQALKKDSEKGTGNGQGPENDSFWEALEDDGEELPF